MKTTPHHILACAFLSTLATTTSDALPFRNRKGRDEEDNNENNSKRNIVQIAAADSTTTSSNQHQQCTTTFRSPALELYYKHGEDEQLVQEIHEQAINLQDDFLIAHRRHLHQHPEVMYQEQETSAHIQSVLESLGIAYSTGWAVNTHTDVMPGPGGYGVVADIGTGQEPCVLLRGDIDALPIQEQTPVEFRSKNDNRMHACGHDAHTTMLLGAASILKSMEDSLNGTVRLLFQPAEEGGAGAKRALEEGLLEMHPKPRHAMGMHVWPTLPSGSIASRPGPLLAACERFELELHGVGGHAAMPHLTIDPIVAASALIMNLQTIVSRHTSPLESGVVSITQISAGEAFNIIPATATLRGTIRALSTDTLLDLRNRVEHMVHATAELHGCNVTLAYSRDFYPPTVNDPVLYETFSKDVGAIVSAEGFVRDAEPTMGAEDFAFLAESIPSTFFLLGQGSATKPASNYGLHHPKFALDESVLPRGVELHVNWAVRALRKLGAA